MCSICRVLSIRDNSHESTAVPTAQNGLMSLWIIEYTYDKRDALRASLLDEHSWYLAGLADAGAMIACGSFDGGDGEMLIASGSSTAHVEDLISGDPYVCVGTVTDVRIRRWEGRLFPSWQASRILSETQKA